MIERLNAQVFAYAFYSMATVLIISSDERFSAGLQHIMKKVCFSDVSCSVIDGGVRQKLVIEITCPRKVRTVATAAIDAIAEVVVADCKSYYIQSRVNLPIEDTVARHAFIRALVTFDRDTDKIITKTLIKLTPEFLLDSFYEFMIDVLKSRWNEVCHLANENMCYLVCRKTFAELLRFLISNIDSLSEEAHLFLRGDEIEVLGRGLKPINDIYINETLPCEIKVVNKLVAIAPKKIFLHQGDTCFDDRLIRNIENLFGCCVLVP